MTKDNIIRKPIMKVLTEKKGYTISRGTLRMEDLLSAALEFMKGIRHDNTEKEIEIEFALMDEERSIDLVELWAEVSDYLNTLVSEPWYFGSLEGDASEVGFFLDPDYLPKLTNAYCNPSNNDTAEWVIWAQNDEHKDVAAAILKADTLELEDIIYNASKTEAVLEAAGDKRLEILNESDTLVPAFREIRCDFFDEDKGCYVVDAWFTGEDSEMGYRVAEIYPDRVEFIQPCAARHKEVLRLIEEAKKELAG